MIYAWSIIIALSLILEFVTQDMVSIWFTAGGTVALILAICDVSETWQIITFILISLALVLIIKTVLVKFSKNQSDAKFNADSKIGTVVKLVEGTENGDGRIKLGDVEWTVKSKSQIAKNKLVKITGIEGNKYIIEEIIEKGEKQ